MKNLYIALFFVAISSSLIAQNKDTKAADKLFNIYPIYDWRTEDIWVFHSKNKHLPHFSLKLLIYY